MFVRKFSPLYLLVPLKSTLGLKTFTFGMATLATTIFAKSEVIFDTPFSSFLNKGLGLHFFARLTYKPKATLVMKKNHVANINFLHWDKV
jgi:hypothetical protein